MKSVSTFFTITLLFFAVACGSDANSVQGKQKTLAGLKKQALELNAKIISLENEIEKAGGAGAEKTVLVNIDTIKAEVFTHYIELQGKIESESVSFITPRAGGGQVRSLYVKRGDLVRKGQLILQLDNTMVKQSAAAASNNVETLKAQAALAKSIYEKQSVKWFGGSYTWFNICFRSSCKYWLNYLWIMVSKWGFEGKRYSTSSSL